MTSTPYRPPDGFVTIRDANDFVAELLPYWHPPVPDDFTPHKPPDITAILGEED